MGVGSYCSKFYKINLISVFVNIEILLGVVGGFSSFILHFAHSFTELYYLFTFLIISIIGTLVGLEIPLIARIINISSNFKDTIANVFSFDYIGALLASVIFPLFLLPYLGIMRTAFVVGFLNILVALINIKYFQREIIKVNKKKMLSALSIIVMIVGFFASSSITGFFEEALYQDQILITKQSSYQRIVLTRWNDDYRLFLNGNLQFSSRDENRYHEALVHLPMSISANNYEVLVLGGGDGLAAREILKHHGVKQIDIIDIDPIMTGLAKEAMVLKRINKNSMNNPKVNTINMDAFNYVAACKKTYSTVIIDLPDPNDTGLGKLYSKEFYGMLGKVVSPGGAIITQATSPYFSRKSFWCIENTMDTVFHNALPVNIYVPSFGQWGFVISILSDKNNKTNVLEDSVLQNRIVLNIAKMRKNLSLRFLDDQTTRQLFNFDSDCNEIPASINTLDTQNLVKFYEYSLKYWF